MTLANIVLKELSEDDLKVMAVKDLNTVIPRLIIDKILTDEQISELRYAIPQSLKILNYIQQRLKEEKNHTLHSIEGQGCRYCSEVQYLERIVANANAQRSRT